MITAELLHAVKERVDLGHTEADITDELLSAGYDRETIARVYAQAVSGGSAESPLQVPLPPDAPEEAYNQPYDQQSVQQQSGEAAANARLLPFGDLLQEGINFALRQKTIALLLAGVYVLYPLLEYGAESFLVPRDYREILEIALLPVALVALICFIIGNFAAIYICAQPKGKTVTIREARGFLAGNFFGLFVLSLMTGLAVMGGFVFFFIPMIYLLFVYFVYIRENKRYLQAMLRSHQIVSGHWWAVALRVFGMGLLFFLIALLVGFVLGFVSGQLSVVWGELASIAVSGILTVFFSLVYVHVYGSLFNSLLPQAPAPSTPPKSGLKVTYIVLMVLGPISFMAYVYLLSLLLMMLFIGAL